MNKQTNAISQSALTPEQTALVKEVAEKPGTERAVWKRLVLAMFRKAEHLAADMAANTLTIRTARMPAEERRALKKRCMAVFREAEVEAAKGRPELRLIHGGRHD